MSAQDMKPFNSSMAAQQKAGFAIIALLAVFILGWGGLATLSGAVIATGRVTVESSQKRIQHREGGIVYDILVRDGDQVKTGQVLARLDSTVAGANAAIVQSQIWQLTARKFRLEAERDGRTSFSVPTGLTQPSAEFDRIIAAERALMTTRRSARVQKKSQLNEQIAQSAHEIDGLAAQVKSQGQQARLIREELVSVRDLHAKGYASITRLNQLEREAERLQGEKGQLEATIARTRTRTSEIRLAMLQIDSESLSEIMAELKDTETKLSQLNEQQVTTTDAMNRVEIKAPVDGTVQQLLIHTRGGVVAPGETLMHIVPKADDLVVEARIDPQHIDQVASGRSAYIRFTSFASQTTPEARGRVDMVSPDVETDEKTGISYYKARLTLKSVDLPKSLREALISGMPVEVHIETTRRNALSYFMKPLTDQMNRTFKEE
jgi:HlyD family secretion protein